MASYEFLVNNNYAKKTVSEHPSDNVAAVCCEEEKFEHVTWSGTIELALAKRLAEHEGNHLACFFGRAAFRQKGEINWYHPASNESMLGLVSNNKVMAVVEHNTPYVYVLGSSKANGIKVIEPDSHTPKSKANVTSIEQFKQS